MIAGIGAGIRQVKLIDGGEVLYFVIIELLDACCIGKRRFMFLMSNLPIGVVLKLTSAPVRFIDFGNVR